MELISEEFVAALREFIEAIADEKSCSNMGQDTYRQTIRISKLEREFIDTFVFGETQSK